MPTRALILDGDRGFADTLRGWLAGYDVEVEVSAEWNEGLATTLEPGIVVIGIDPPDEAAFSCCERVKAAWPGARIVLATNTVPLGGVDLGEAHAGFDKRTLTPEELYATIAALIGPLPGRRPESAERDESQAGSSSRVAELEEEVRRLRWELEETRSATQAAPHSRGLLKLSAVVASKEKELVRLKREIAARDHKVATSHRTAREASARALFATRERDAATAHEAQLQGELEAGQAEVRRLRHELQRQAAEAQQALANLIDERRHHDETRRQHQGSLVAQTDARALLEAQLREEKNQAVAEAAAEWSGKLDRLLRKRARARAARRQQLENRNAQHAAALCQAAEERAAAQAEAEARAAEERTAAHADRERQREELQRIHDLSLAEALAAHADAERRAEQQRADRSATEVRLQEEKAQAVAAVVAEWEGRLDALRRAHADSVETLRQHFQDQLSGLQASQDQQQVRQGAESEGALQRSAQELAAARMQAARLEGETRQRYEEELVRVQAHSLESLAAAETQLREEKARAVAAAVAEWEGRLDDLRRAHADSVEALRRRAAGELAVAQTRALQLERELRKGFEQEQARAEARHLERLTALETRLREEKDEAVAATVLAWEGKLEELRQEHAASLDALGRQYQDELASLQAQHQHAAAEREAAHETALARASQERAAERSQLERLHELSLKEVVASHLEAERRVQHDQRAAQAALEQRLRQERTDAVAATVAEWESRLDTLRRTHAQSLETLRRHLQDQLEELRASEAQDLVGRDAEHQAALRHAADELAASRTEAARLDQETRERYERELARVEGRHLEALRAQETRLRAEEGEAVATAVATWQSRLEELSNGHAAGLEALRQEHQEQLAALRAVREQELAQNDEEHEAELRRVHEELAATRRKTVQPGPAHILARHAEALSALEARLTEEKEQAVAATVAEWKAKVERLRRGHADALAALRREHEDQLLALDGVRQERPAARPAADPGGRVVPLKAVNRDRSG